MQKANHVLFRAWEIAITAQKARPHDAYAVGMVLILCGFLYQGIETEQVCSTCPVMDKGPGGAGIILVHLPGRALHFGAIGFSNGGCRADWC